MLKCELTELMQPLTKFFNKIFTMGIYPTQWYEGYICPIFKKGIKDDPSNYRGITVNSCIGKLFTKILNNRLEKFLDKRGIIRNEQIGFSKGKRTSDHLFILRTLAENSTKKGSKPIYACFVDFRRAFDTVWHKGLFFKLRKIGVSDMFYTILKDMYRQTKLCVKINDHITDFFTSNIGVRQGDTLSPNLFKIFLNDFQNTLDNSCDPVQLSNYKLNCLLYADDLVLLSSFRHGMQSCIDKLSSYCNNWGLEVNLNKTKCMTFNALGRIPNYQFSYKNTLIENVRHISYLGVTISASGHFTEAKNTLYNKSLKAYFKLCKSFGESKPKISTFFHIFDHTVKPVILYGSEIWGTFNTNKFNTDGSFYNLCNDFILEKLNIKACRFILGLNKRCTNAAVRGEIGRFPILFNIIINILKYWVRINESKDPLIKEALHLSEEIHESKKDSWLGNVYKIIEFLGLKKHDILKKKNSIKNIILKKLSFKYSTCWEKELFNDNRKNPLQSNKLRTYRLFKPKFCFESYLNLNNQSSRNTLCKFRVGMHKLEIEKGRHLKIQLSDRICKLCQEEVEDEIHFLLSCKKL